MRHDCKDCELALGVGKEAIRRKQLSSAVETFVSILISKGQGPRHKELTEASTNEIALALKDPSMKGMYFRMSWYRYT